MTPGSEKPVEGLDPRESGAGPNTAEPASEAGGDKPAGATLPPQDAGIAEAAPGAATESGDAGTPAKPAGKSAVREWVETLAIALVVALLIRTFVVQVYLVEGPSMEPTLHTAERLLVNKLVYLYREPKAGEIIVLQDPNRPQRELIKRVIAVGGETVEVKLGVVYVNGQPLKEPYINSVITRRDDVPLTQVEPGFIYVMGDNRSWSFDSRQIGPIALKHVDGKAFFMFWPADKFGYGPLDQPRTVDTAATGTTK